MGMFGQGWKTNLATFGAGLSDVGSALNHSGGGNLQLLQAQRKADAQEAERKAKLQELAGMFGGPSTQAAPTAQTPAISPNAPAGEAAKAGYVPETPQSQAPGNAGGQGAPQLDWQKLMAAQIAGVDPNPILKIYEMMQPSYQNVNMPDGGLGVLDTRSGQTRQTVANPNAQLEREEREARIEALKYKGEGTRIYQGKDGLYEYDPVTKTSRKLEGWAPHAPVRGSSGGGRRTSSIGSHGTPETRFKVY